MTLAKRIYENQLRIEREQNAPFLKKPLQQAQLSEKAKQKMVGNNPFYRLENVNVLSDLQLTKLLSELKINLPSGISPTSPEGQAYITNQLSVISNQYGQDIRTVNDLIKLYEDPNSKIIKVLENIENYQGDIKSNTKQTLDIFLELEREGKKSKSKREEEVGAEETKSDIPEATPATFIPSADLNNMTRKKLIDYATTLGIRGVKGKNKADVLKKINDYIDESILSLPSF